MIDENSLKTIQTLSKNYDKELSKLDAQLALADYNQQEILFEIEYVKDEYADLTINQLISITENNQTYLSLSFVTGEQIKKLLNKNCVHVTETYKSLSSQDKEGRFEDFLQQLFSLATLPILKSDMDIKVLNHAWHQVELQEWVKQFNERLGIDYGRYIYLDCEGLCLICWVNAVS